MFRRKGLFAVWICLDASSVHLRPVFIVPRTFSLFLKKFFCFALVSMTVNDGLVLSVGEKRQWDANEESLTKQGDLSCTWTRTISLSALSFGLPLLPSQRQKKGLKDQRDSTERPPVLRSLKGSRFLRLTQAGRLHLFLLLCTCAYNTAVYVIDVCTHIGYTCTPRDSS